jgi:hypothetical protein
MQFATITQLQGDAPLEGSLSEIGWQKRDNAYRAKFVELAWTW